jgi:uncharacterized membrane protein
MKNLKLLLSRRLKPIPRWLPYVLAILPLVGFVDSVYLTVSRFLNFSLPCTVFHGCDVVTRSAYSTIGTVPVALLGAVYYLALLLIAINVIESSRNDVLYLYKQISWCGLIFSAWFMSVQAFILNAYCTYCIISAIDCAILFVLSLLYIKVNKQ